MFPNSQKSRFIVFLFVFLFFLNFRKSRHSENVNSQSGGIDNINIARHTTPTAITDDRTWRKDSQKTIYSFLASTNIQEPVARVRHKLNRWHLHDPARHWRIYGTVRQRTPAWAANHCRWRLHILKDLVTPRVQSAVFSTIWNRWTTSARFQRRGPCVLGCSCHPDQDKIEHYCRCPVVREILTRQLNLDPQTYANLHTFMLVHPLIDSKEILTVVALLIYGVYTTFNNIKHSGPHRKEVVYDAVAQAIREGARGHRHSRIVLNSRWSPTVTHTPLPTLPLHSFDQRTIRLRNLRSERAGGRRVAPRLAY